jgi:hypothetical protein
MRLHILIVTAAVIAGGCDFDKGRHLEGAPSQSQRKGETPEVRAANEDTAKKGWVERESAAVDHDRAGHAVLELEREIRVLSAQIRERGSGNAQCSAIVGELEPQMQKIEDKLGQVKQLTAHQASPVDERAELR